MTNSPVMTRSPSRGRRSAGTALLAACALFLCSQIGRGGDLLLPLGPDSTRKSAEAYAHSVAQGVEPLGINSAGEPGERNFDNRQATVRFSVGTGGVTIAAFSDDGVDVWVTDLTADTDAVRALNYKGTGQSLPNLKQSLHDLDYTFEPDHTYELTVDYLNTLYTGEGDIDGAQLIAYGGTTYSCGVSITGHERPRVGCIGDGSVGTGYHKDLVAVPAYSRVAAGCPDKQETYAWEIVIVERSDDGESWRPLPIGDNGPFSEGSGRTDKKFRLQMSSPTKGHWRAQVKVSYERTGPNCGLNRCVAEAVEKVTFVAVEIEKIEALRPPPIDTPYPLLLPVPLAAHRLPGPSDEPWPDGQPVWSVKNLDPAGGTQAHGATGVFSLTGQAGSPTTSFGTDGEEFFGGLVQGPIPFEVTCKCGLSQKSLEITFDQAQSCGLREIKPLGANADAYKLVQGGHVVGPKIEGGVLTLKVLTVPGLNVGRIDWGGDATEDPNDPTQATVPIAVSKQQTADVMVDGNVCGGVTVWPVSATLEFKGDNAQGQPFQCGPAQTLSEMEPPGLLPPGDPRLGQPRVRGGWIKNQYSITAAIAPEGVGELDGVQFDFKNFYSSAGYYKNAGGSYQATTSLGSGQNVDDDDDNTDENLDASDDTVCLVDGLGFSELVVTAVRPDGTPAVSEMQSAVELLRVDQFWAELHLITNKSDNSFDAKDGVPVSPRICYENSIHAIIDPATKALTRGDPVQNFIRETGCPAP